MEMTAAVLYGPEDVRVERVKVPEIGDDEVLIKIGAALTCGTDRKVYLRGGHPTMIKPPDVFGHEFAGTIVQAGKGVCNFREGMRVVCANSAPCNKCFWCKAGKWSSCEDIQYINGAYAEYIKVPGRLVEQNLLPIPEHISFKEAALTEPLACVAHGVDESCIKMGDNVAVIGLGPIGLMFVRLSKLRGAKVIAVDLSDERLSAAGRMGADVLMNAILQTDIVDTVRKSTPRNMGVDVAIEAAGVPQLWEKAILMARRGGIVNLFGGCPPGTKIELDTKHLHYSELTIKGVYHHTPYFVRTALELICRKEAGADILITHEIPLSKINDVLRMIVDGKGIKIAVIP
jgi:L-iditol 2-dehydrogenase